MLKRMQLLARMVTFAKSYLEDLIADNRRASRRASRRVNRRVTMATEDRLATSQLDIIALKDDLQIGALCLIVFDERLADIEPFVGICRNLKHFSRQTFC